MRLNAQNTNPPGAGEDTKPPCRGQCSAFFRFLILKSKKLCARANFMLRSPLRFLERFTSTFQTKLESAKSSFVAHPPVSDRIKITLKSNAVFHPLAKPQCQMRRAFLRELASPTAEQEHRLRLVWFRLMSSFPAISRSSKAIAYTSTPLSLGLPLGESVPSSHSIERRSAFGPTNDSNDENHSRTQPKVSEGTEKEISPRGIQKIKVKNTQPKSSKWTNENGEVLCQFEFF